MILDALDLETDGAQHCGALRDQAAAQAFERLAVRPGEGDRGIARHTRGKSMAFERGELREAALDALVHVAEALFEPQHLLAHDREAEMTGLDDACVHRADRDLMHALAVDAHEFIGFACRRQWRKLRTQAQRKFGGGPGRVAQPGARIDIVRACTHEIECGTLHACGGGKDFVQSPVAATVGQRQFEYEQAEIGEERGAHHDG